MKLIRILTIGAYTAAFALTGITAPTLRADEKKHEHADKAAIPATADAILAAIQEQHEKIAGLVKAKTLKEVHEHAEHIAALAKALPDKVAADKKARVQGSANNIAKVADSLHDAADAGEQTKTEAELKKLDGVIAILAKQAK